mmetsp:Transcript_13156/g.9218  ORF Transcript_13156/g.9218 Transcript_13156/m.9218 type:complete len:284 (-) Transcript_13156:991-1842(-)
MLVNELLHEQDVIFTIINLLVVIRQVSWVRSHDNIRESAHLNPSLEKSLISSVFNDSLTELFDNSRSVSTNIRVSHGKSTDTTVHESNHGRLHTIKVIISGQLISHPHKTSMSRSHGRSGSREPHDLVTLFNFVHSFLADSLPLISILIMVNKGISAVMKNSIEGHVFTKVVHPAASTSFFHKVVLDDILDPNTSIWVSKIYHCKFNADAVDEVSLTLLVLDEIAIFISLSEVVSTDSNSIEFLEVSKVRIDIDKWLDTILLPIINHRVPSRVLLMAQLPVPK